MNRWALIWVGFLLGALVAGSFVSFRQVNFGISQSEIFRLIFLVAIFVLLLATLGYQVYRDQRARRTLIAETKAQAVALEKRIEEIGHAMKRDALARAEKMVTEVKEETSNRLASVDEQLSGLSKRFDEELGPTIPVIRDTHRIVDEHLERPSRDTDGRP